MNLYERGKSEAAENLLHMPPDPNSEPTRSKARRTICRNGRDVADRALLLEVVGLIRRDEKTQRWQLT